MKRKLFDVLSVDPGMHTAHAFWVGDLTPVVGQFELKSAKKALDDSEQFAIMWAKFRALIQTHRPRVCVMEGVRVYNSAHSMMSATSGDLIKLTLLIGGYCAALDREGIKYHIIPATRWKGQLTKQATKAQVEIISKQVYKSEHITDAVALGLWWGGLFPVGAGL